MSETIIDAIDFVIPSLAKPLSGRIDRTNSLCASGEDFPYQKLLVPDYVLTWALLDRHPHEYRQVTAEMVAVWSAAGINWQQRALINLKVASKILWTHRKLRQNGSIGMAIMMHADGFGSSRVLLWGYLQQHFPDGYYVAIPDRRIGIITPRNLSVSERQETEDLLQSYYERASMPIGSQLLDPEDLIPKHDGGEN